MQVASMVPALRIEGCTVCGLCEAIAPEVFRVSAEGCILKAGGRWDRFVEEIRQAALMCPSGAIRWEREERIDG